MCTFWCGIGLVHSKKIIEINIWHIRVYRALSCKFCYLLQPTCSKKLSSAVFRWEKWTSERLRSFFKLKYMFGGEFGVKLKRLVCYRCATSAPVELERKGRCFSQICFPCPRRVPSVCIWLMESLPYALSSLFQHPPIFQKPRVRLC